MKKLESRITEIRRTRVSFQIKFFINITAFSLNWVSSEFTIRSSESMYLSFTRIYSEKRKGYY